MRNKIGVQHYMWWVFLLYYAGTSYLASHQSWDVDYALKGGLILSLCCLAPYYSMAITGRRKEGSGRIAALMLMPSAIALTCSAALYLVFTQLNITDPTPPQILPRSMFPGVDLRS